MTQLREDDKNDLDRIDSIYDLGGLFTAVYRDSDYRFGCLHFAEPMGDGNYPDYIAEPPDFMKSGWTYFHEIPMVLHPDKGALLLSTAGLFPDDPPEMLTACIEEEHSRGYFFGCITGTLFDVPRAPIQMQWGLGSFLPSLPRSIHQLVDDAPLDILRHKSALLGLVERLTKEVGVEPIDSKVENRARRRRSTVRRR